MSIYLVSVVGWPRPIVITIDDQVIHMYVREKQKERERKKFTRRTSSSETLVRNQEESRFSFLWVLIHPSRQMKDLICQTYAGAVLLFYPPKTVWAVGRENLCSKDVLWISLIDPKSVVRGRRLFCRLIMSQNGKGLTALLHVKSFFHWGTCIAWTKYQFNCAVCRQLFWLQSGFT